MQMSRNQSGLEAPRVLDLCTGSGCVALAIAQHLKTSTVTATDISPAAVEIARKNTEALGLADRVKVLQGDLFDALAETVEAQPFHFITANPPYIPTGQIETLDRSVRDYEPVAALDGGLDGLAFHRRILDGAVSRLLPGGNVLLEIAFDQAEPALQLANEITGLRDVRILKDNAGHNRVLAARRAG
jgi:release factor glutamine methyltransferase